MNLKDKHKKSFIVFDIKDYYPSIKEKLLTDAVEWAQTLVRITPEEKDIIFKAKRSVLYFQGKPWLRNKSEKFDVSQGLFDGAETSDLCGLFLLSKIQHLGFEGGLYAGDGGGTSGNNEKHSPPSQ